MSQQFVSIIVTCFNQAHCIENTLESVRSQTYSYWECIVVDDGSTDNSSNIIKEFVNRDDRFSYIYQTNSGVAKARNSGFAKAKGNFINFLDGDDTFLPQKIELQLRVFEDHPKTMICICDHQHYHVSTKKIAYYTFEPIEEFPLKQFLYNWQNGVAFPPHAAMYRRTLWESYEIPFAENYHHRSEDWVFNIIVALKQQPYFFLNKILCTYHHDKANYTADIFNSASSAIYAAFYIQSFLPEGIQSDFLDHTVKKSFNRYVESKKVQLLQSSGNWRLGNILSKPFFELLRFFKKLT
ncbi:glycosyltransferase family 2 protein [Mongoliitalea lutea]|uniref:Glycosyltransferase 2-like domain-containing protein n=1 Tax=Mongoliitalea lutea TaxID=849756 RepID=A0A8J3CW21_9BACT|nr:glycosyltransferase family 2 protein [Mongoliitalea lutea]GHB37169.1 hypothetical protein GCM10008106_18080 [Mongoliitalea lutea]